MDKPTCSVDGCDRPIRVKMRQLCLLHYTRWHRYGDPLIRLPGEVANGKRICPSCHLDIPLARYGVNRNRPDGLTLYCRPCMVIKTAAYRAINPQRMPDSAKTPTECAGCGTVFLADKKRHKYCTPACSKTYKNRDNLPHVNARRARLREAFVELFDRFEIFERDGWICQICGHPIDRVLKFPDPGSVSLDHIVPVVHGGKHEPANVQAAHFHCNNVKSDSVT